MLEYLFGSKNKEKVLFFLYIRGDGYAREIAKFYDTDLTPIQNQLNKMEIGNILISRTLGKVKVFSFNERYPFLKELMSLLEKAFGFLPLEERDAMTIVRKRPRRSGKPF